METNWRKHMETKTITLTTAEIEVLKKAMALFYDYAYDTVYEDLPVDFWSSDPTVIDGDKKKDLRIALGRKIDELSTSQSIIAKIDC